MRRNIEKLRSIIVMTMICLSMICMFTGCSKNPNVENENATSTAKDIPVAGGEIKIATKKYQTLNPLLNKEKEVDQVLSLIFDPLVKIDENLRPIEYLAKSVTVDNVGASMDVVLKSDVRFHNGDVLTADDVVYSLDVLKSAEDTVVYKNVLGNIGTWKKIDDMTVRIYLRQAYANPKYALAFPIISKNYYSNSSNDTTNNAVGTGMFKVTNVSQMQEIKLEKNKEYFGDIPYIDTVTVMVVPEDKTMQTAFKQKQIDILFTQDMIAGQYTGNDTVTMMEYDTMNYDFLGFNFTNEKLANAELRRIIAHAINKKSIVSSVYYGYAKATETIIHPKSFLYAETAQTYEYDLKMAKKLLESSEIDKSNLTFNLLVNEENDERGSIAEIIKQNLAEVGITINVEKVKYEDYLSRIQNKNFDMVIGGWHLLANQDISFAFSSAKIYQGQNYISYSSEVMDQKLLDAYTKLNEEEVKNGFEALQEFLGQELPYISIAFRENVGYINNVNVGGKLSPLEHNLYNGIEKIYIRKSAQK